LKAPPSVFSIKININIMKKKSWKNLITEQQFWDIIEDSLKNTGISYDKQIENLKNNFKTKSIETLIGFHYHGFELYRKSYDANLWAAAEIVAGCSDSSFHGFRNWLISRSQTVYNNALENPDSLLSEFEKYQFANDIFIDDFLITAAEFYKTHYKLDFHDMIDAEYEWEFEHKSEEETEIVLPWDEHEDILRDTCPKLYERYKHSPLRYSY
jgi:Protein of unknown function (DUF4240)